MDLPAAYVDLGYMSAEPLSHEMQTWLSELGASAGETIIRQIEKETEARRLTVEPKIPAACFGVLPGSLEVEADVRESA